MLHYTYGKEKNGKNKCYFRHKSNISLKEGQGSSQGQVRNCFG